MCKIEIKDDNHKLKGIWLWDYAYSLDGDAFSESVEENIKEQTGLNKGSLGDWWVSPDDNPIMNWQQMITLALNILNCAATRLFVHGLYIKEMPTFEFKEYTGELPSQYCSGAKRVNASAGDYTDYSESTGLTGLMNQMRGVEVKPKEVKMSKEKFRLSGKDESCCVEGSWLDWCLFACNILASKNTELIAPELYAPTLSNDNY